MLADLYNKIYDYPLEKIKIIGITGTNGKTIIGKMICHLLKYEGVETAFIGNEEVIIGEKTMDLSHGSLSLEELYVYLDKIVKKKIQLLVMEMNPDKFHQDIIKNIEFDTVIYTNLDGECVNIQKHMERQKEIFRLLSENGMAIINTDDHYSCELLEGIEGRLMITYGLSPRATVTASSIDISETTRFNCCIQRGITRRNENEIDPMEFPVFIPVMGRHNVYNGLASISAALIYGVTSENIARGFKNFKGVKRRMNLLHDGGYKIIDDISHNPLGYESVFEGIQSFDYENLYVVKGIMNKETGQNKSNAVALSNCLKMIKGAKMITTCGVDLVEEKNIFHQTFEDHGITYEHEDGLEEALKRVLSQVKEKDLILLLGDGFMDQSEKIITGFLKKEKI